MFPKVILRQKQGEFERVDADFFDVFGCKPFLLQAVMMHRRDPSVDVVAVKHFVFIW